MPTSPQIPGLVEWKPLARGGFSVVWEARQLSLDRLVAVKVHRFSLDNEAEQRRFLREAGAAGRMSGHPGIVSVYDAGLLPDDRPYLVMELCPGGSLTRWLREEHRPSQPRVVEVGIAIADALAAAHARGVLHRDVKPANILVDAYDNVGLADFGMASVPEPNPDPADDVMAALTPVYAAPEAIRGEPTTQYGDVFSLAATLYALLAGRPPRSRPAGAQDLADLLDVASEPIAPVPDVHPELMALLMRALADRPADRLTAAEFRDELKRVGALLAARPLVDPAAAPASSPASPAPASRHDHVVWAPPDGEPAEPAEPASRRAAAAADTLDRDGIRRTNERLLSGSAPGRLAALVTQSDQLAFGPAERSGMKALRLSLHRGRGRTLSQVVSGTWSRLVPVASYGRRSVVIGACSVRLPDGRTVVASSGMDGTIRLWNAEGQAAASPLRGHTGPVTGVAFGRLGHGRVVLASASHDGTVRLWDPAEGRQVGAPLVAHTGWVTGVAFGRLPDGRHVLASSSHDQKVQLWDPVDGTRLGDSMNGHKNWVTGVTFGQTAHGELMMATGSLDGTIRLWGGIDPAAPRKIAVTSLAGHTDAVTSVAFGLSTAGKPVVASGSRDHTVRLWDCAARKPYGQPLRGHEDAVTGVAFGRLAEGRFVLASASRDHTVRIWEPAKGTAHSMSIFMAPFTPEAVTFTADTLVAAGSDGVATFDLREIGLAASWE